ncbi:molybdopterin-dependent oxidoreductase [Deinococcus sedimenti]|uniref:Oxidoreductase molybdopterin-binding domain-containing protein n=1 Tax=Deinococcus sedimenti TaxID=1867090 RepID=A0ABQ2S6F7_9DEIO|nr:molybdopterin-dependent oxidoreductase [Deinococcus sedimenti]GGS01499.1 hypothetical protein GCM10008960_30270 [Deinococcus sedimenti]
MRRVSLLVLLTLCACTRPASDLYQPAQADARLSQPGPVVLTVVNAAGKETTFTRAQLAGLGLVSFSTPDPSRKNEQHEYTGPLLSEVLNRAEIDPAATLHLVALDKYKTDLNLVPIRQVPVMLALTSDGDLLEPRNFGPVYMTFPYGGVRLDPNVYNAAWVWQLYRIEERPGGA